MIDIYLASPYSDATDPAIMQERFEIACEVAARLMAMGYTVFSPIAHSHPIAQHIGNPTDGEFGLKQDKPHFDNSRYLGILTWEGWKDSNGMSKEFIWIIHVRKPIIYIDYIKRDDGRCEIDLFPVPERIDD